MTVEIGITYLAPANAKTFGGLFSRRVTSIFP